MDRPTYIASCSFGKDSIATILLAHLHNEPLDRILTCEVMFDWERGISGEDPDHIKWMKEVAIPRLKEITGIDTEIVANRNYDYYHRFYKPTTKSKYPERIGKLRGFLLQGGCEMNGEGKMKPIRAYFKQFNGNYRSYVGIAIDEPIRLARLKERDISLLAKYGYTEKMAYDLCAEYDLLSPIYKTQSRGGCWFCPNKGIKGFCDIRNRHPELFAELEEMAKSTDKLISPMFCHDYTFEQLKKRMDFKDKKTMILLEMKER